MPRLSDQELHAAKQAKEEFGSFRKAAAALGLPLSTFQARLRQYEETFASKAEEFEAPALPSELPSVDEIRNRCRRKPRNETAHEMAADRVADPVKPRCLSAGLLAVANRFTSLRTYDADTSSSVR